MVVHEASVWYFSFQNENEPAVSQRSSLVCIPRLTCMAGQGGAHFPQNKTHEPQHQRSLLAFNSINSKNKCQEPSDHSPPLWSLHIPTEMRRPRDEVTPTPPPFHTCVPTRCCSLAKEKTWIDSSESALNAALNLTETTSNDKPTADSSLKIHFFFSAIPNSNRQPWHLHVNETAVYETNKTQKAYLFLLNNIAVMVAWKILDCRVSRPRLLEADAVFVSLVLFFFLFVCLLIEDSLQRKLKPFMKSALYCSLDNYSALKTSMSTTGIDESCKAKLLWMEKKLNKMVD